MRIQIMTAGTTGSVAPYTGLGHRLLAEGHEVELVAQARFAELACCGLRMRSSGEDPFGPLMAVHRAAREAGWTPAASLRFVRATRRAAVELVDGIVRTMDPKADLVLLSSMTAPVGRVVAGYHGLDSMGAYLQPDVPTAEFPPCTTAWRPPGRANRLRGRLANGVLDVLYGAAFREVHDRLGLPRRGGRRLRAERERGGWPIWHGFSPAVVPRPADWRWGLEVAGYWWPHECPGWQPPAPVSDFLAAGPPPVFVGFGSLTPGDPGELADLVGRALRLAGVRGIVQAGWAGLSVAGDDVLTVGPLPHGWLFPRTAAVVHHAGAGTVAAGLRAGVPAVPVPVFTDQPWWASRLVELGVSPGALPFGRLSADRLAALLRAATTQPRYAHRAGALAERLGREDGAGAVVRAVAELSW
jgi:sterol 3beta-glucosyltransferase